MGFVVLIAIERESAVLAVPHIENPEINFRTFSAFVHTGVLGNFDAMEATVAGQQLLTDETLLAVIVWTLEWLVSGVSCN